MDDLHVHFWSPIRRDIDLDLWDPDLDPERYHDGYSHAFLELFVRLRDRGERVTLGPDGTSGADVVVTFSKSLSHRTIMQLFSAAKRSPIVLIRSDRSLRWRPFVAEAEVMPSQSVIDAPNQIFLPLLPQRGLIPRHRERFGQVTTAVIKASPENVPAFLLEKRFLDAAERLGVRVRVDSPKGSRPWHDFSDVDVALCLRDERRDVWPSGDIAKPATRLINAWSAGAIPLCSPEVQYTELARDKQDALMASSALEVLEALKYLRESEDRVAALEREGIRRARSFGTEETLNQWWMLFESVARSGTTTAASTVTRVGQAAAYFTKAAASRAISRIRTRPAFAASRARDGSQSDR